MAVGIDRVAVTTIYSKIPGDCMRFLVTVLVVVVALLAVAVGAGLWLLKDPNRFKPELEALIRDTAGMEVSFDGDLSWQLWPPVVLKGESIRFEDESTRYELAAFGVRANLLPLLQGGELEVSQLRLDDLLMTDKAFGAQTRIDSLRLDTFVLGQPSPLSVAMTLENEEGPASKVTVEGPLTYFQEEDRLMLAPMAFRYDDITGTCDVAASNLSREPALSYTAGKDDLLPLDTFRAIDWEADCTVPELAAGEEPLRNLSIRSANKNARNTNTITIPDAFGGSVETTVSIDTRNRTPAWLIDTNASDIQSQALMDLIAPSLKWAAPLLAGGQLSLRGNTMEA
ncbi:MAG: AsmA family protein, partial [Pseudomonadota bacterium]